MLCVYHTIIPLQHRTILLLVLRCWVDYPALSAGVSLSSKMALEAFLKDTSGTRHPIVSRTKVLQPL